jgi:BirA family transcriptional regulator, biotin operon repressor / biotin---[acetyl-CoA-carboxylase] ligase
VLSEGALSRALERVGLAAPVRFDEVTGSTNRTALAMAAGGAPEWTLVAAGHQTQGRGRLGRGWTDVPDRALMFSVVLRPRLSPARAGLLPLLAGWSMASACRTASTTQVVCKWPNDLRSTDGKVGGILAESRLEEDRIDHVVLGAGVNLGVPPPRVEGAAAIDADAEVLLGSFLEALVPVYEPNDPSFPSSVVDRYRSVCETLGRPVRATTTAGDLVEGVARDVDETGALLVRTARGIEAVRSGEVEHLVA